MTPTPTKLVSIIDGDIEWVGVRFINSDGKEEVRKLYPSCRVGECRRPGSRMIH